MKPLVEELEWIAPHEFFHALAAEPFALFLDSATAGPARDPALHGRWSFIAAHPFRHLCWRHGEAGKPFDLLKSALADLPPVEGGGDTPPFPGGAAGFFGYGLGRTLERLPPEELPFAIDDQHLPDMALGFYDTVLAFDMLARRAFIVSTGLPERDPDARRKRAALRAAEMRERLASPQRAMAPAPVATPGIFSNFTCEGYERAVARVIDYIHAGDIFQVEPFATLRSDARRRPTRPMRCIQGCAPRAPRPSPPSSISARARSSPHRRNAFFSAATEKSKRSRLRVRVGAGRRPRKTAAWPPNFLLRRKTARRT